MSPPGAGADNRPVLKFTLRVGERPIEIKTRLPEGEVRVVELLPILRKFNDAVIGAAVEDTKEAGRTVSCCAGCGACCRQVVPIGEDEALSLLEWFDGLPSDQQEFIHARFKAALDALEAKGMLDRTRSATAIKKDQQASMQFALDYFAARVACPFLINESCGIYPIRPMKCREYLVTSPAENCEAPSPETIRMVELPTTFSKVLFHFDADKREDGSRWLPMILLFEWAMSHRAEERRRAPSVELFREFLGGFAESVPETLQGAATEEG